MEHTVLDLKGRKLTKNHQIIANYIIAKMDLVPFMVESDLAKACNVSVSSVSRFWEAIGFKSFKEFKLRLMQDAAVSPASKVKIAFDKLDRTGMVSNIITDCSDYLKQTADRIRKSDFEGMTQVLNGCRRLHVYASGPSACLSALLEFRLKRFGMDVTILTSSGHELYEDLLQIEKNDVILLFGFVQESPEISVLFDYAGKVGCPTVLITDLLVHPMIEKATFCFYTARGELWEFHSMIAPLALVEGIILSLGKAREEKSLQKLKKLHGIRDAYQKVLPRSMD